MPQLHPTKAPVSPLLKGGTRTESARPKKAHAPDKTKPKVARKLAAKTSATPAPGARALVKATTVRLDPAVQVGLELAQSVLKMTANKIINEAVALFVAEKTAAAETQLEDTLRRIRAYRRADPGFGKAIAGFAAAEAQLARSDPVDGRVKRRAAAAKAAARQDA